MTDFLFVGDAVRQPTWPMFSLAVASWSPSPAQLRAVTPLPFLLSNTTYLHTSHDAAKMIFAYGTKTSPTFITAVSLVSMEPATLFTCATSLGASPETTVASPRGDGAYVLTGGCSGPRLTQTLALAFVDGANADGSCHLSSFDFSLQTACPAAAHEPVFGTSA